MSELDPTIYSSDGVGTTIAKFFAELDRRIDGQRGTSAESAAVLAEVRPVLWAQSQADPERFVQLVWTVGAKYVERVL